MMPLLIHTCITGAALPSSAVRVEALHRFEGWASTRERGKMFRSMHRGGRAWNESHVQNSHAANSEATRQTRETIVASICL